MQFHFRRIFGFLLIRIIVGFIVIVCSVLFTESLGRSVLDRLLHSEEIKNLFVAIVESALAITAYIVFFQWVERRKINELRRKDFFKLASLGFAIGIFLQASIILVIYLGGYYKIEMVNPAGFLLPGFSMSLTAGFIAELMIRGVFFRILEEKLGTTIMLFLMVLIFAILHMGMPGANPISVSATAIQAGLLLSAAYVATRSLWVPIFLHFAYDFAEPGIFGGINPGISSGKSLFTTVISGNKLISGGLSGPQNSIQGLIFCLVASFIFLYIAKKKNRIIPSINMRPVR
jgi:uncharacterized protein